MTKLTNAKALKMAIELAKSVDNAELVAKLEKMAVANAKKNASGEKKPTATQKANVGIKENILNALAEVDRATITEIVKALPTVDGEPLSNQKVSALVRQLVLDGAVIRTEDKRKAYFSLA